MKKILNIVLFIILLMFFYSGCDSGKKRLQEKKTETTQKTEPVQLQKSEYKPIKKTKKDTSPKSSSSINEPLEYQLAVINKDGYVSNDDITVTRFRYLLESLDNKTIESKQQISDMVVAGQKLLREKYGVDLNLLDLMEGVNNYIPIGSRVEFARKMTDYIHFEILR